MLRNYDKKRDSRLFYIPFFFLLFLTSCNFSNKETGGSSVFRKVHHFKINKENFTQNLIIKWQDSNTVNFNLTINNNEKHCVRTIQGLAKDTIHPANDAEYYLGLDGIPYPTNQYIYQENDCLFQINIALLDTSVAFIKKAECKTEKENCIFILEELMEREK